MLLFGMNLTGAGCTDERLDENANSKTNTIDFSWLAFSYDFPSGLGCSLNGS